MGLLEDIKIHIQNNKTEVAFNITEQYLGESNTDLLNDLLVIRANWQSGFNNFNNNIISLTDWGIISAKANHSLLVLIERIPNQNQRDKEKVVLFLYSNPNGKYDLGFDKEMSIIRETLEKGSGKEKFGIIVEGNVTLNEIETLIQKYKPYIVHICVSSLKNEGNGKMLFEGTNDIEIEVPSEVFMKRLIRINQSNIAFPEIVIFDTCFSYKLGIEASKYVKYVIAMKDFITNDLANLFSRNFYTEIFNNKSVEIAFESGIESIELSHELQRQWNIETKPQDIPKLIRCET